MTQYKKVELLELIDNSDYFRNKNVEVVGKVASQLLFYYDFYYDHPRFRTSLVTDLSSSHYFLELLGYAGLLRKNKLEKELGKTFESQIPISIKGEYRTIRDYSNSTYLWVHHTTFMAGSGELSLSESAEGKISLIDEGKLSFLTKWIKK